MKENIFRILLVIVVISAIFCLTCHLDRVTYQRAVTRHKRNIKVYQTWVKYSGNTAGITYEEWKLLWDNNLLGK